MLQTLSNALFTGGWGRGDSTFERLACWLVLGGEGERIMLQELPLSSCYSPRCMHNLRRILYALSFTIFAVPSFSMLEKKLIVIVWGG